MLVGREKERQVLEEAFAKDESGFIAVYGRRRVGKTFLVRETFGNRFTFQHAGLANAELKDEISEFCASLKRAGLRDFERPGDWLEAFELLKDLIEQSTEKKKIIFIDELSWMDTPRSKLVMALESFWNGWASGRKDILLIVCSSASSWIINKIFHNKGGLYNRLTGQIHLRSFTLSECEKYIQSQGLILSRQDILQCYMIMGGVPYYWSFLKRGNSLAQNIDAIFFAEDAPLKNEFKYLYTSIFKDAGLHMQVIDILAHKKTGMSREEIIAKLKRSSTGGLTTALEELEASGFIRKYNAFGKKKKNAIYQLMDNFTLFYYQFMETCPTDEHFWSNQLETSKINAWLGIAFERVCLLHVKQMKIKLGISGVLTEEKAWACQKDLDKGIMGSQIDLLIVRKDRVINLCEMKYSQFEYTINESVDRDIRKKIHDFQTVTKTKHTIFPTLVTTYGLIENIYSGNIQSVITLDDLFAF